MLGRIAVELGLQVFMRCNGEDVKWYGEIKRGEQFYIRTAQNIKVWVLRIEEIEVNLSEKLLEVELLYDLT